MSGAGLQKQHEWPQVRTCSILLPLFFLVPLIFAAPTYYSASSPLAPAATRRLPVGDDPPPLHRLFWSIALTLLPLPLMFVGGLQVLQTAVLVVSLPILVVGVYMSVAVVKIGRGDV